MATWRQRIEASNPTNLIPGGSSTAELSSSAQELRSAAQLSKVRVEKARAQKKLGPCTCGPHPDSQNPIAK